VPLAPPHRTIRKPLPGRVNPAVTADDLVHHMCEKLGIRVGETTPDGLFTVTEVECAGACAGAPVVQINNAYHEKVDADYIDRFIDNARNKGEEA